MKEYIGDSVYVSDDDGYGLTLTTENGFGPSNTIYLKPRVLRALVAFAKRSGTEDPTP